MRWKKTSSVILGFIKKGVCIMEERIPEFDEVEVHENVTVQILKNSKTGEVSVGWYRQPNTVDVPGADAE